MPRSSPPPSPTRTSNYRSTFLDKANKRTLDEFEPSVPALTPWWAKLKELVNRADNVTHASSWGKVKGQVGQLRRARMFDSDVAGSLAEAALVRPGHVGLIDLSDTESPYQRDLAIAEVLRAVQEAQERAIAAATKGGLPVPRTLVIVEEAHEFISAQRIRQMPTLFGQIARIARRGRKRWLGLCFVT